MTAERERLLPSEMKHALLENLISEPGQPDITNRGGTQEIPCPQRNDTQPGRRPLGAGTRCTPLQANCTAQIIGRSRAIREALRLVESAAPTDSTVLLMGETGTGKRLFAKAIHDLSRRKTRSMILVNCASLPCTLVESELFGREKGAYTGALTAQVGRFQLADGSTLFLDEIGEVSPEVQVKLLRVLEEGEFERLGSPKVLRINVRVIAATNRDLAECVRDGTFRKDLFYRLNVCPIRIPPLRERLDDIPLLVKALVIELTRKMNRRIPEVAEAVIERLQSYLWPGNVRELRNVIEHALIMSSGTTLEVDLPRAVDRQTSRVLTLEDMKREHITNVLDTTGWRIKGPQGAAKVLGMKPSTLYSVMNKLGITKTRANRESREGLPRAPGFGMTPWAELPMHDC
ncbi:MAG: sigma 54-interacting transcriptional regulator [bacterium]